MQMWKTIIALFFLLPLITQCSIRKPVQLDLADEVTKRSFFFAGEGKIVPGRVTVVLGARLWKKEFEFRGRDEKIRGVERLRLTPRLEKIFSTYSLKRVWRSMPQLEQRVKGRVRVITYPEWVIARRSERGMRKNARPYKPPQLARMQGAFELEFPKDTDLRALVEAIREVPGIVSAEAVVEPLPLAPYFPNEAGWVASSDLNYDATLAQGRWGFHNTGPTLASGYLDDFDIDAPEAWEIQRGDPQVVVVVFDNGVDVTHEDLYLNVFLNNGEVPTNIVNSYKGASPNDQLPGVLTFYDLNVPSVSTALAANGFSDTNGNGYIDGEDVTAWWGDCASNGDDGENCNDNDGNGYEDDLVGWNFIFSSNRTFELGGGDHGTPVAGLIAAVANNAQGIAGAASSVRILPVRGSSSINKITYALSFPEVRVINESQAYGFSGNEVDVNAILGSLEPEGVIYIASYGNHNAYFNGFDPSRREHVVSISNFDSSGKRAMGYAGSTYGPKNDVAAPGSGMYSLQARTATSPSIDTRSFGGTSAASPVAAGVAALVASQDATLSPEQIRQVLRMTASDPAPVAGDMGENSSGWDIFSGWGLVNAGSAITEVMGGAVYPEANILSLYMNYLNRYKVEGLAIHDGVVPVRAYMGLPSGGTVDWTLMRSRNWDMSGAVQEAAQSGSGYSDGTTTLYNINTDALDSGRHIFELDVTTSQGVSGKDRAVIDLPRAYISNLKAEQLIAGKISIEGFAYGPGFTQYSILVAPGWSPAPADFSPVYTSTVEKRPSLPAEPGPYVETVETLLTELDIFSLPITLPASGEATIRVETNGTSTWSFDERVTIDNTQPPQQVGFPVNNDVLFADYVSGAPTAADLDGDGDRELIIAGIYYIPAGDGTIPGKSTIHAFQSDGMPLSGWPVYLPWWEYPSESIAVGDLDGDRTPEVVVRSRVDAERRWCVRIFNHNGTELQPDCAINIEDPTWSNGKNEHTSPVLADISLNGKLDILLAVPKSLPEVPAAQIRGYTLNGALVEHVVSYSTGNKDLVSQPAVGDIDGDGEDEVVSVAYASTGARVYAWKLDGSLLWSYDIAAPTITMSRAQPVLMDVDNDGVLEIIVSGGLWKVHTLEGDGTLLASSTRMNPYHIALHPVGAQLRPGETPEDLSVVYTHKAFYTPGGDTYLGVTAVDPATGALTSGWTSTLNVVDGDVCDGPVVANISGDSNMEIALSNCPSDSPNQGETPYQLGTLDDLGNVVSDGNQFPLNFPTPVAATPLVTDLDGDGDVELVLQTYGYDSRIYAYDLPTPAVAGGFAWGEYGHDPRNSGNYHGDLRILSPATLNTQALGPFDDPSLQSPLLIRTRFSRGAPVSGTDSSKWTVSIGGQNAVISEVTETLGEYRLVVDPIAQPATGAYLLRVEFNDGGIKTWDAYRDAVRYGQAVGFEVSIYVDGALQVFTAPQLQSTTNASSTQDVSGVVLLSTSLCDAGSYGCSQFGAVRALLGGSFPAGTTVNYQLSATKGLPIENADAHCRLDRLPTFATIPGTVILIPSESIIGDNIFTLVADEPDGIVLHCEVKSDRLF